MRLHLGQVSLGRTAPGRHRLVRCRRHTTIALRRTISSWSCANADWIADGCCLASSHGFGVGFASAICGPYSCHPVAGGTCVIGGISSPARLDSLWAAYGAAVAAAVIEETGADDME